MSKLRKEKKVNGNRLKISTGQENMVRYTGIDDLYAMIDEIFPADE